jgi:tripartite ATP-independent transporter DctP family solute receptor
MRGKYQHLMFILILSLLLLSIFSNIGIATPRKIQFGYVTAASESDPYCIASTKFAELIEERTNGEIVLELFPSGQLGDERDMIEGMQIGSLDAGLITNAPIGGFVSSFMALDLPFVFSSADCAHKTLDGIAGEKLLEQLDNVGIKGLAFAEGGFRHMINNIQPINTVEDTQGIKFRVMKSPIYLGMFKYLGSNAIAMPWGETFTAVQQGVMDGLEIPISVIWANKYYEVTKYLSLTGHTYSPLIFMVSNSIWNSLSDEQQEIFKNSALEAAVYERAEAAKINNELLKNLEEEGMIINEVDDKEPFQEVVEPLYKEFEDEIGKDMLDLILEESAKYE